MKKLVKDTGKLIWNIVVDSGISAGMLIATIVAVKSWLAECNYLGGEIGNNLIDVRHDVCDIVRCKKLKKN